jgi:hypothetical protein
MRNFSGEPSGCEGPTCPDGRQAFASGSCSAVSCAVRAVAGCRDDERDDVSGDRASKSSEVSQDPKLMIGALQEKDSCLRFDEMAAAEVGNRANCDGRTRRTSKIHWRKGRSTVTGHKTSDQDQKRSRAVMSCASESEPLPGFLSHLRVSARQVEPSRSGSALPGWASWYGGVQKSASFPAAVLASWSGARRIGH